MILIIDNYDSFTYNLVQLIGAMETGLEIKVFRNDALSIEQIEGLKPTRIVISPGPCTPDEAGISVSVVRHFCERTPILGVCLGHQCIGQAFGGTVVRAPRLMHGKTSRIHHDGTGIYYGLTNPFVATRYHSLALSKESLSDEMQVTAWTDRDELMGIRHMTLPVEGVQFHPESFLTEEGGTLVANFLRQQENGRN